MTSAKTHFPPLGMSPAVWGPIFWATMHIVSLGYPNKPSTEDKAGAAAFYNSLASVIPCAICKSHYRAVLKATPVEEALNSRHDLIHWVFDIHNKVNVQLGKPIITFQEYINHMQLLAATSHTKLPTPMFNISNIATFAAIFGILGFGYYLMRSSSK
jgi:hypothetical protein